MARSLEGNLRRRSARRHRRLLALAEVTSGHDQRSKGRKVGFPRFKRRGRDRDRFSLTAGVLRLEADRRHLTLPVLGTMRTHENTRRLERLIVLDRAKILGVTISRHGERLIAAVRVSVARPQRAYVTQPGSVVGIDVGVRRRTTVATTSEAVDKLD